MYDIIPLILILVSISAIIIIVVRKFSILANLDVENIPAEREAIFKELIITNRLKRNLIKRWSKVVRFLRPIGVWSGSLIKTIIKKLEELKEDHNKPPALNEVNLEKRLELLFKEAEDFMRKSDYEQAEKKYIEIIGLESKNVRAFKELGKLYFEQKNYDEAKQTYEHVLKLKQDDEDIFNSLAMIAKEKGNLNEAKRDYLKSLDINKLNAQTYYNLALTCQAMNDLASAVKNIKKSLKIEPNNPRYLDSALEISIMNKDKICALTAYDRLFKVNPENQKIKDFKRQIDGL